MPNQNDPEDGLYFYEIEPDKWTPLQGCAGVPLRLEPRPTHRLETWADYPGNLVGPIKRPGPRP